ncbi:hypothetical protein SMACR_04716 [Sordaria macrospora]|uniref:Uncharacterized protein n=1 Tax=Sordaria macrospora TaxID=5147 RepID=A0A8S8ZIL2_SORMA|nr:hypothetical protein SMACR_04716 [Sordaria macrospora]
MWDSPCSFRDVDVLESGRAGHPTGGSRATVTGQWLGSGRSGLASEQQPQAAKFSAGRATELLTFASFSKPLNPPRRSHHHQAPKTPRQDFLQPPSQWVDNTTTFLARRSPPNTLPWVFLAPSSAVSILLPAAASRPLLLPPSTPPALMRPTSSRSSSRPPRPPRSRMLPLPLPPPSTKVFQNDSCDMIETDTRGVCGLDLSCVHI